MNNIFLTGERWNNYAGELLLEIKNMLLCDIGGYWVDVTRDDENKNIRVFDLTSLYDGERGNIFFKKDDSSGISKLNIDIFNTKGVEILERSFGRREVFVLKEIGFLESKAKRFTNEVKKLLDSPKIVIALVKSVRCTYIDAVMAREDANLFKVTEENKDAVKQEILKLLISLEVPLKI